MESLLKQIAPSHKDVLEKYLPSITNRVADLITHVGEQNNSQMAKLAELANGMTAAIDAFDKRFDAIEAAVYND